ncbi:hypothetical protein [Maritimibacter dapengensis]|uniref:Uncharacterized protein n=1 Tax=Maritimibacter dapengensis TaxID=2836868 RepID=A0ABS6T041_9RHOB|nr:hypothetical protein [Maritimibacter dapengensis]MBV7378582.1 hypothetical protein [Maritimibacter dapengensis]
MNAQTTFRIVLLLWTVIFIASFVDFGSGGEMSLGVVSAWKFAILQILAAVLAVTAWIQGRRFDYGSRQRAASRIPGIIELAILIGIVLFVVTAQVIAPGLVGGR